MASSCLLLSCCALLWAPLLMAQGDMKLLWGPGIKWESKVSIVDIFGSDSSYFYLLGQSQSRQAGLSLAVIETDSLNVLRRKSLELPEVGGFTPYFLESLVFAGRSYLITSVDDPSKEAVQLWAFELDSSLEMGMEPTMLAEISREVLARKLPYSIDVSEQDDYLCVSIPLEDNAERNEKRELRLFNSDLGLLDARNIELPHHIEDLRYTGTLLDSDHAYYMLITLPSSRIEEISKAKKIGRDHALIRYDWKGHTVREKFLSIGTYWIYEARLALHESGDIQVFGYFSNMVDLVMSGTFSVAFHRNTGAITAQGLNPFSRNFKSQFRPLPSMSERPDLALFQLDDTYSLPNNEQLMVSELRDRRPSTIFNPATGTYLVIENYHFDTILLTSILPSSEIRFNLTIPKFQNSSREVASYTSYLSWHENESLYLVYNDHDRNAPLESHAGAKYSVLGGPAHAQAVLYELRMNGELIKHVLFRRSPLDGIFTPYFHYALPRGMVMLTVGNGLWQFFRLSQD